MKIFRVLLTLRYTRISCMPFRAKLDLDRLVQAEDRDDALRQACLCIDRELDEILASVNAINVTEVWVEPQDLEERPPTPGLDLWNDPAFALDRPIPQYIVLKQ